MPATPGQIPAAFPSEKDTGPWEKIPEQILKSCAVVSVDLCSEAQQQWVCVNHESQQPELLFVQFSVSAHPRALLLVFALIT